MKKFIVLIVTLFLLTGCTVVRIDTDSIDNTIDVVLSKNNTLFNRVGKGYKYYVPRGVTYIDTIDLNDKLYCNGNYYYLYIDAISYYYKNSLQYTGSKDIYFYKEINSKQKSGYVAITEEDNLYHIVFVYNYAIIEAMVPEKDINEVILNASYILSTVKFNDNVIKLMLEGDYINNKEEKYDKFSEQKNASSNKLEYADITSENNKE